MRRSLRWMFGSTLLLSLFALWTSGPPRLVSAVEQGTDGRHNSLVAVPEDSVEASGVASALPAEIPRLVLGPALRDVFLPYQAAAAASEAAPAASVAGPDLPAVSVSPPQPQAPVLNARYLGRMATPEGKRLVYLMLGTDALTVSAGQQLDDGYLVESITDDAVTLLYPPLGVRVAVPIPLAPPQ